MAKHIITRSLTVEAHLGVLSDLQGSFTAAWVQQVANILVVDLQHAEHHLQTDKGNVWKIDTRHACIGHGCPHMLDTDLTIDPPPQVWPGPWIWGTNIPRGRRSHADEYFLIIWLCHSYFLNNKWHKSQATDIRTRANL